MSAPGKDYKGWLPKATPETAPFWEGCRAGKLMIPRCRDCRAWIWYPRPFCTACESWNIEWAEASRRATLYTFTVVHRPSKGWEDRAPYVLAMADLEEGPRLTAILEGAGPDPQSIPIGATLSVDFTAVTDSISFPVFHFGGKP